MYAYTSYPVGSYHNYIKKSASRARRLHFIRITMIFFILVVILTAGTLISAYANKDSADWDPATIYVGSGDSLWTIAQEHVPNNMNIRSYIHKIKKLNGLESSTVFEGQKLFMP